MKIEMLAIWEEMLPGKTDKEVGKTGQGKKKPSNHVV
jgi:hypothetical protein